MYLYDRPPDNVLTSRADYSRPVHLRLNTSKYKGQGSVNYPEEASTLIGKTVSHYRILEKIGEGGMGYIYKALDLNLERNVALKVLSYKSCKISEARNRFLQEARLLSSLEHPHICTIHDIFEDKNGVLYMVMPC